VAQISYSSCWDLSLELPSLAVLPDSWSQLLQSGAGRQALRLRPMQITDEALFVALYTDPQVQAHTGLTCDAVTAQDWFRYALTARAGKQLFYWLIEPELEPELEPSAQAIGLVAVQLDKCNSSTAELGILLQASHWHQGYGKQALALLRDCCFACGAYRELVVQHQHANQSMAALAASCGFIQTSAAARVQWQQFYGDWQQSQVLAKQGQA